MWATRIEKFIANTSKTAKTNRTVDFLRARIELLEQYWSSFSATYEELVGTTTHKDIDADETFNDDRFFTVEVAYVEAKAWCLQEIASRQPTVTNDDPHNSTMQSSQVDMKLPKIEIPVFNGEFLNWPSFKDLFESLVHTNSSLSEVQKLHYLKSSVRGEAELLLKHVLVTANNYSSAWDSMLSRFNNTRAIVNTNIDALVSVPIMQTETADEMRRVLDNFNQHVSSLENLSRPVAQWDDWLVYFLTDKLDTNTRKDWETSLSQNTEVPSYNQLTKFLESRMQALCVIDRARRSISHTPQLASTHPAALSNTTRMVRSCHCCRGSHLLLFCPQFRAKTPEQRTALVRQKGLCLNCLRAGHNATSCPSEKRCQRCQQRHHTMIHANGGVVSSHTALASPTDPLWSASLTGVVLLATAIVQVIAANGRRLKVRALIDQGSESNFMSQSLANSLRPFKEQVNVTVYGVGQVKAGTANSIVTHEITSIHDPSVCFSLRSLVLPSLSQLIPSKSVSKHDWPHIVGLKLADPEFEKPARIDLILGVEVYASIIQSDIRRGPPGTPVAQATRLGYILSGRAEQSHHIPANTRNTVSFHASARDVDDLLRRFWEIEEPPMASTLSPDEANCEEIFRNTHRRSVDGRYVVQLPLKSPAEELGSSKEAATQSLLRLERRFQRDEQLKCSYDEVMEEYMQLKHMEHVPTNEEAVVPAYYLPHQAVLKPTSTTTRLRVVYNASQKTTSGKSLNDILYTGPKLLSDIFTILIRWRVFPYVLCADTEKMFRQIWVDKNDVNLQRLLYRRHFSDPILTYRILTVLFGSTCASYLACRVMLQLAEDHETSHPAAARIIRENLYCDDALFGSFDIQTTIQSRDELIALMREGGFKLRKWLANTKELLANIAPEDLERQATPKVVHDSDIKTLGLTWDPEADCFQFHLSLETGETPATKRSILSDISRIYDPFGWLAPVTIKSKIFFQRLWLEKIDWDDTLPGKLNEHWLKLRAELTDLHTVKVNRWIGITKSYLSLELHGFCDASLNAYGAAVYLRIATDINSTEVNLLAAKTKVSPLKTVSLPRLELCGAALLADLVVSVRDKLNLSNIQVHLWSDSTVTLSWLKEHPSKWKVFVANRVSMIHEKLPQGIWHHIHSKENQADRITRGISATELTSCSSWWFGPAWLKKHHNFWPKSSQLVESESSAQEVRVFQTVTSYPADPDIELLKIYSSFAKLARITAYCRRFYNNARTQDKRIGPLSMTEIDAARTTWTKIIQSSFFSAEISRINKQEDIPNSSKLAKLRPFMDQDQILRVRGRLTHSQLPYEEKYPIILPKESNLTRLLIRQAHNVTLHGGVQITLQYLRSRYWIIGSRSLVKQTIRNCVVCCRLRAVTKHQLMADLPSDRVTPAKPFLHTGIDYAGHFFVKPRKGRNRTVLKAYVCIFVCFVTKAVHLELVFDLTADAFIAAFRRFVSRRGRCAKIYSDNARNFVTADKQLTKHVRDLIRSPETSEGLLREGTEWSFIPPGSPHFGGLWEAGVKSFKHHFKRVVGTHILDIEEMLTLTCQIEACLNSRPLYPITDEPEDMTALTPGHFLVGESLLAIPTPSTMQYPVSRLGRWELVQNMQENIWQRWRHEYMHHLQLRHKWRKVKEEVKINDLVILKDENLPPTRWALGRITNVHPGSDGLSRAVTVKYAGGTTKRAITKVCVLPVETSAEQTNVPPKHGATPNY